MKKWIKMAGAMGMALALALMPAMQVNAYGNSIYGWSYDGESTLANKVAKADGTVVEPTTQVNFHIGYVTGVVPTTPFADMANMLGLTEEQITTEWLRPVLYVGAAVNGDLAIQLMKESVALQGGTIIEYMNLLFFKWTGSNYENWKTTTIPITLVVGLTKDSQGDDKSYGLLHLKEDGTIEYYYDTDSDKATVTFQTSDFTGTYTLFSYPKSNTPAAPATGGSAGDDYDDVPKTGNEIPFGGILLTSGILFMALGMYLKRR